MATRVNVFAGRGRGLIISVFHAAARIMERIFRIDLFAEPPANRAFLRVFGSRAVRSLRVAFLYGARVVRDESLRVEWLRLSRVCLFRIEVAVVWQKPPVGEMKAWYLCVGVLRVRRRLICELTKQH